MALISAHATILSSKAFTFEASTGVLAADLSDLGNADLFSRLYADAADAGFGIRSDRTGAVRFFSEADSLRDGEGELVALRFKPLHDCGVKLVIIYND